MGGQQRGAGGGGVEDEQLAGQRDAHFAAAKQAV